MSDPAEFADLTDADYERLAQLRQLLRRFLVFSEKAAAHAGLTAQQHQAMLAIKGFDGARPVTTGELAERLGIRHHSAVGLVDRLAAKGLIRRQTGPKDHRQVLLELRPKAQRLLKGLSTTHREELRRLAPLLRMLLAHFEPSSGP
ncbi:MAG TPA: MarR family transcriptional regulator [Steroidobacteraceae bacterium]|jgi:DNA-binding MarR family transcriptional regulator|nr:MarR family transcriptional regulator [Steroidobacteraceae bacterium]